jgi:hypothetical protein
MTYRKGTYFFQVKIGKVIFEWSRKTKELKIIKLENTKA